MFRVNLEVMKIFWNHRKLFWFSLFVGTFILSAVRQFLLRNDTKQMFANKVALQHKLKGEIKSNEKFSEGLLKALHCQKYDMF